MKATVSGICLATIEALHPEPASLQALHAACVAAGLPVLEAQVYAGVQSMASTGKCGRGAEKRTWTVLDASVPRVPATERTARRKQSTLVSLEQQLQELEDALGEPTTKPRDKAWYAIQPDGVMSTEYMLERARQVVKQPTIRWFHYLAGGTPTVGFLI